MGDSVIELRKKWTVNIECNLFHISLMTVVCCSSIYIQYMYFHALLLLHTSNIWYCAILSALCLMNEWGSKKRTGSCTSIQNGIDTYSPINLYEYVDDAWCTHKYRWVMGTRSLVIAFICGVIFVFATLALPLVASHATTLSSVRLAFCTAHKLFCWR